MHQLFLILQHTKIENYLFGFQCQLLFIFHNSPQIIAFKLKIYYNFFMKFPLIQLSIFLHITQLQCSSLYLNDLSRHQYSQEISAQIAEGIRTKLLANLHKLANLTAVDILRQQLENGSRNMKILDAVTANQIFGIFGLTDPGCDNNQDGYLINQELKCLNKIWKFYVLPDENSNENLNSTSI